MPIRFIGIRIDWTCCASQRRAPERGSATRSIYEMSANRIRMVHSFHSIPPARPFGVEAIDGAGPDESDFMDQQSVGNWSKTQAKTTDQSVHAHVPKQPLNARSGNNED